MTDTSKQQGVARRGSNAVALMRLTLPARQKMKNYTRDTEAQEIVEHFVARHDLKGLLDYIKQVWREDPALATMLNKHKVRYNWRVK